MGREDEIVKCSTSLKSLNGECELNYFFILIIRHQKMIQPNLPVVKCQSPLRELVKTTLHARDPLFWGGVRQETMGFLRQVRGLGKRPMVS